jgi:hypothetical protein
MKSWLRLTVVTCTVGGGFTLLSLASYGLLHLGTNPGTAIVLNWWFAVVLSVFIVISGLALVHDPCRSRLAEVAVALQIPYFCSPLLGWTLISGVGLSTAISSRPIAGLTLVGGNLWIGLELGAHFTFSYFNEHSWGIGVNWVALLLFTMLRYARPARS